MTHAGYSHSELITDDPNKGCFLCEPPEWQTVFVNRRIRVIAGLGPLRSGYILVAPKDHVATSADLDEATREDFCAVCEVVIDALHSQYGSGYTAYEHGKLGACRVAEERRDTSHFCFHCHRVFVPGAIDVLSSVRRHFETEVQIGTPQDLVALKGKQYVYYETGSRAGRQVARAFVEERGVPSQFMRRQLMPLLDAGRDPSWAADYRLPVVIKTAVAMGIELAGLNDSGNPEFSMPSSRLLKPLSLDGLSGVGKTTLGRWLQRALGCVLIDSGLVIRRFAATKLGAAKPTPEELMELVTTGDVGGNLPRGPDTVEVVLATARDPEVRSCMLETVRSALNRHGPGIVLGRSAWQMVPDSATRIVLEADFPTRVRRRFLANVGGGKQMPTLAEVAEGFRSIDVHDGQLLPIATGTRCVTVDNGRRPLHQSGADVLKVIERS